jgi:hypothetical protein
MKPLCQRLAAVLLALLSFQVSATTHYVDVNGTSPATPYTNWATAAVTIQDAANVAVAGDLILVTNGVYQTGGNAATGRIFIHPSINVQSVNGPAMTVINGAGVMRCALLSSEVTLSGFTLANGAALTHSGGGASCLATDAVMVNCIFTNNSGVTGGGANSGTFSNCTFVGNIATNYGGGVYGGTIYQCSFVSNSAGFYGGGSFQSTLVNCSLIGNTVNFSGSGSGGGAYGSTLINCLLTGNQAGYRGAAAESCTLINCTVVGNTGQADGIDGSKLTNCISYYNSPDNGTGSGDGNVFNNCCTTPLPYSGVNTTTNPPLFANLSAGDFHLNAASPCINAGNNSFITNSTDLDGNPRIVGGIVDIGAYEFQSPVRYVNVSNTAPVSPFTNWTTAATNIQDAIDVANTGDFIVVSNGTYNTGGRAVYGVATNRVTIDKAVTVQSVNGAASTILVGAYTAPTHGGPNIRCAYLTIGAVLSGFTLTNGGTPFVLGDLAREASGGGVWCEDSSAIVSNCVIAGNIASQNGGGAYQGTLFNCILTNNSANRGGGACSNVLVNCTLIKNSAMFQNLDSGGGAIYCTLSNCLLVANKCNGGGGGANYSSLTSCVVSNNTANFGGGVCVGLVNNSLISSNRAFNSGGGAYSNTLNNCVLKNNLSSGDGGGAFRSVVANCTVVRNTTLAGAGGGVNGGGATNSIVYYNLSSQGGSNFTSSTMMFCDTMPLPINAIGNITNEPAFVNLAAGNFHLQSNSPCINSGNNTYVTSSTDLDGNPRIKGGTVDIGAYEFQSPSSVLSYAWAQQYGLPTDGTADYADADHDGMNNWQEWRTGTIPTDASSLLKMLTPTNDISGTTITWQSVSGMHYFIQRSSDLGAQPPFSTIQSNIIGQAGTTSYTDTNAVGDGQFFYRVGVQ